MPPLPPRQSDECARRRGRRSTACPPAFSAGTDLSHHGHDQPRRDCAAAASRSRRGLPAADRRGGRPAAGACRRARAADPRRGRQGADVRPAQPDRLARRHAGRQHVDDRVDRAVRRQPGAVQFNVAANASNNDDSPLGDYIYVKAFRSTLSEMKSGGCRRLRFATSARQTRSTPQGSAAPASSRRRRGRRGRARGPPSGSDAAAAARSLTPHATAAPAIAAPQSCAT